MAFVENIVRNKTSLDEILQFKRKNGARQFSANKTAAITIQRHYRGYYTRLYLVHLKSAAIIIQKNWRGYIARKYFNNLTVQIFVFKSIAYYNKAATIIQKYYKGYYTRKHVLDVKKMTKWMKEIQEKNNAMSKAMKEYKLHISTVLEKTNQEKVKCMIVEMVNKNHSKLRTVSKKGVFSKRENSDSEFEKLIRNIYIQINKK